jgi:hypothetical protein
MKKEQKPKCRVNWNKPYRAGTICNFVDEETNECNQENINRCPCGGIVRTPGFKPHPQRKFWISEEQMFALKRGYTHVSGHDPKPILQTVWDDQMIEEKK